MILVSLMVTLFSEKMFISTKIWILWGPDFVRSYFGTSEPLTS